MSDSARLLFLHIPKTAGTSLRLGAVQALGAERCYFDYGVDSADTSPLVRNHVYQHPDLYRFAEALDRHEACLLGGHFNYRRYAPLFRSDRVLAFCRHPAQQLMSHFQHFVRHHNNYRDDLATFLGSPGGAGMQTRVFGGFPLEAFGFIGVTERYEESLRVIRADYGIDVAVKFANANPEKGDNQLYTVDESIAEKYTAAVSEDIELYNRANALLDARLAALDAGYVYVHGAMQSLSTTLVKGFAFRAGSAEPAVVDLVVNDHCIGSKEATQDRPNFRTANVVRNAYVGFEFRLPKALKPADRVVLRASSGQVLASCVVGAKQEQALK